ncbi:hypothetical protein [Pelagerythrobacter marensis]|uniref:Flagellar FliJ protein n=1 Tax=Pelagerythrobacter marensis TaxID=543877 RepID=A0A0G3XBI1_9SPHN|nr:hypothetical protein [Pelagerythrobacter marensis]AKM07969.1 hypothetical protein AM2010_1907 [Pelagerythrobacter marensis]
MSRSRAGSQDLKQLTRLQALRTAREQRKLEDATAAHRKLQDAMKNAEQRHRTASDEAAQALSLNLLDPERMVRLNAILRLCDQAHQQARHDVLRAARREDAARRDWHAADRQRDQLHKRHARLKKKEAEARDTRATLAVIEHLAATSAEER